MTDGKKTVCVVDDDEVVRDSMSALLSRRYTVLEFASGMDYLKRAASITAGCVLLDVHMPDMTGIELLRILRAQGNTVPVVMMTGRKDPVIEADARALDVTTLLDKPIPHTVLAAALEKAFARSA
jgi:two-component system response regulator FixJ